MIQKIESLDIMHHNRDQFAVVFMKNTSEGECIISSNGCKHFKSQVGNKIILTRPEAFAILRGATRISI